MLKKTNSLFQVSLLQSLMLGDYHGSISVGDLKQKGDTGLGTFDGLNGEMIVLDGEVYRAAADGTVEAAPDDETVPFSVVTFLDKDETQPVSDIGSIDAVMEILNDKVSESGINRFYMIRMDGTFDSMNVRSVYEQKEPYEPLVDVLEHYQTVFDYENIKGTVVGLYCPPYFGSLNAPGWHLHFISDDRQKGGHVLGLTVDEAELYWDPKDGFEMQLPGDGMFSEFDLTIDQSEDIRKVETK